MESERKQIKVCLSEGRTDWTRDISEHLYVFVKCQALIQYFLKILWRSWRHIEHDLFMFDLVSFYILYIYIKPMAYKSIYYASLLVTLSDYCQ